MKHGLNIGCGPVYLNDAHDIAWENSDFAEGEVADSWKLDKRRDFTKPMDDIESNSIDVIVAWHIIEHVGLHERDNIIKEWFRVLKPGAQLLIACPDLTKIAKHIVDRDGPWADWFICMVNVFGPYNGYIGDYHKWGYDQNDLMTVLKHNGFSSSMPFDQSTVVSYVGIENATKLGFADYNVQLVATK